MKQSVIRYTLIILAFVAIAIYLGSMYLYKQAAETDETGDTNETGDDNATADTEYTLPANIGNKTGPHE